MNVAIADVDTEALTRAKAALSGSNARVVALRLDVTNRAQYENVAQQVEAELGNIHVLRNNAGVYRGSALRKDLEPRGIGVSVLCPGMVRTRILDSERTRPAQFDVKDASAQAAAAAHSGLMNLAMNTGIDPKDVADLVVRGIKNNQFYLFPHPEMKDAAQQRVDEMLAAFGEADPERVAAQPRFMAELLPKSEQQ